MTKHLYIHIPFCNDICTYCDFFRIKAEQSNEEINQYVNILKEKIKGESEFNQYSTIYIGGGTPNFLSNTILNDLLEFLKDYIDFENEYEFTIECNPEFVTNEQAIILMKNFVNRISLGIQILNDDILNKLNRHHTSETAQNAIDILSNQGFENISCDFIYGLENMNEDDIINVIEFVMKNNIKHVSYYALEVKEGSVLKKENYIVDEEVEAGQLDYINQALELNGYKRYEVSNWVIDSKYESMHNKAYWLTNDWKGVGIGASGFENQTIYKWEGSLLDWKKDSMKLTTSDYYQQVLMMGLRLVDGIDVIESKRNADAYALFFDDLVYCYIRDGKLRVKNLNLLHETLVNIVDETKEKQLESIKDKIFDEED
ncbi:MAG: radical SAM family heme chaperone HemW [Mycoplasma sp.]